MAFGHDVGDYVHPVSLTPERLFVEIMLSKVSAQNLQLTQRHWIIE